MSTQTQKQRAEFYKDRSMEAVFANFLLTFIVFQALLLLFNTNLLARILFGDLYYSFEHLATSIGGREPAKTFFTYPLPEWILLLVTIVFLSIMFSVILAKYYRTSFKKVALYSSGFFLFLFIVLTILSTIVANLFY